MTSRRRNEKQFPQQQEDEVVKYLPRGKTRPKRVRKVKSMSGFDRLYNSL